MWLHTNINALHLYNLSPHIITKIFAQAKSMFHLKELHLYKCDFIITHRPAFVKLLETFGPDMREIRVKWCTGFTTMGLTAADFTGAIYKNVKTSKPHAINYRLRVRFSWYRAWVMHVNAGFCRFELVRRPRLSPV